MIQNITGYPFLNYPVQLPSKKEKKNTIPPENIQYEMIKNLDKHTLAIYKDGKINYYNQRNLKPVFLALEDYNNDFSDCFIADRRISKASAILFAYGNAKNIITPIMTKTADEYFKKRGINCKTNEIADSVLDKNSKIKCPLEKTVLDIDDPLTGYEILKKKVFKRGIGFEKPFYKNDMTPDDYKALDKKLDVLYGKNEDKTQSSPNFKGAFYDATAFIQSHTLLNRGLTNIGGCAIPNAIMSNTKEEALERLGMSTLSVTFAFIMPLFLLPKYNNHFLKKNKIVENFQNNEKKIIQVSKEYLTGKKEKLIEGIKKTGKELGAEEDFNNILERFKGKEDELKNKLLKTHEQILRSDFISTGLLMGSIPWIATTVTEHKTGRTGFSATYNMLEEKQQSKEEKRKKKLLRLMGTLAFALIPGPLISKGITKGLTSNKPNIINSNPKNFDYTSGVSMSKTINATKWSMTGFLAKLPSSRDKYELRDKIFREGGTFVMFFGGDFLINNILGRLSDKFLGTKIMNDDKFKGKPAGFFKKFLMPTKNFRKIDNLKGVSSDVIKKTKNMGAFLYWVSLISNMAILGFALPRFLNKMLKDSVEKDKLKNKEAQNNFVPRFDLSDWLDRTKSSTYTLRH